MDGMEVVHIGFGGRVGPSQNGLRMTALTFDLRPPPNAKRQTRTIMSIHMQIVSHACSRSPRELVGTCGNEFIVGMDFLAIVNVMGSREIQYSSRFTVFWYCILDC